MLADQAKYDDEDSTGSGAGFGEAEEVELTEENADDIINLINSL